MRALLITPASSYQIGHYLAAARRMDLDLHLACNQPLVFGRLSSGRYLQLDFANPASAVNRIAEHAGPVGFDALLGVDELTCGIAAQAARVLNLARSTTGVSRRRLYSRR